MADNNEENENLSSGKIDENIELIRAQIDGGMDQEDALEAAFRAAQEADKLAAQGAKEAAKKVKEETETENAEERAVPEDETKPVDEIVGEAPVSAFQEFNEPALDMTAALQNALKEAQDSLDGSSSNEWEDPFENIGDDVAVKKYIVYVNRDFVKKLDSLDSDDRNVYINDSLSMKLDAERGVNRIKTFKKILKHALVVFLTVVIGTPVMFRLVNISIDLTVSNYSYVQKNFENLYRQKAEKEKDKRSHSINMGE